MSWAAVPLPSAWPATPLPASTLAAVEEMLIVYTLWRSVWLEKSTVPAPLTASCTGYWPVVAMAVRTLVASGIAYTAYEK